MRTNERGQSTVELALCLPLVVLLLAAIVEIGSVAIDHVRVWHAAREAVRVAAVDADETTIRRAAESAGVEPITVQVSPRAIYRRQGEQVTVRVSHPAAGAVPLLGRLFDIDLTAAATMRIEQP